MRQAGGEYTQGCHFFRLDQLFLLGIHDGFELKILDKKKPQGKINENKQEGGNQPVVKAVF